MTEQPFGIRFFHSENELKADRLNKLELCRYNILRSLLQKEKTLYEKTFKQRYEQTLRSRAFRRIGDLHLLKERRTFPQTRFLQRRFSVDTSRASLCLRNPTVRKRPVTYNGVTDIRNGNGVLDAQNDDKCMLCEHIANRIRAFKSDENIPFLEASRSYSKPTLDHDQERSIMPHSVNQNIACEQLTGELTDPELCCQFPSYSPERRQSVHSQARIRLNDSTNAKYIRNGGLRELQQFDDRNPENNHQANTSFDNVLVEKAKPDAIRQIVALSEEVVPCSEVTNKSNNSGFGSKKGRSRTHVKGNNSQKVYHQTHVSFSKVPTKKPELDTNQLQDVELSGEVEENLATLFTKLNIGSNQSVCAAEQSVRQGSCRCQNKNGLREKIDRFLKVQDEYNLRNPLSREISTQSEIVRLQSSTCERRKKAEPKNAESKDSIINEVLTTLGLHEEEANNPEILPPIIQ